MRKKYKKPCMGISRFRADDVVKASGLTTLQKALNQLGTDLNGEDEYYLKDNSSTESVFEMNR